MPFDDLLEFSASDLLAGAMQAFSLSHSQLGQLAKAAGGRAAKTLKERDILRHERLLEVLRRMQEVGEDLYELGERESRFKEVFDGDSEQCRACGFFGRKLDENLLCEEHAHLAGVAEHHRFQAGKDEGYVDLEDVDWAGRRKKAIAKFDGEALRSRFMDRLWASKELAHISANACDVLPNVVLEGLKPGDDERLEAILGEGGSLFGDFRFSTMKPQ